MFQYCKRHHLRNSLYKLFLKLQYRLVQFFQSQPLSILLWTRCPSEFCMTAWASEARPFNIYLTDLTTFLTYAITSYFRIITAARMSRCQNFISKRKHPVCKSGISRLIHFHICSRICYFLRLNNSETKNYPHLLIFLTSIRLASNSLVPINPCDLQVTGERTSLRI